MRLNFSFLIVIVFFAPGSLLAQCDFYEDYSSSAGWTQVGSEVEILNGKVYFLNGAKCREFQKRLNAPLGTTLDEEYCWQVQFEFTPTAVGVKNNLPYSGHLILGLTAGTNDIHFDCIDPPCTGHPKGYQDGITVNYSAQNPPTGELFFHIVVRDSGAEYQSPHIVSLPLGTTHFVKLEKSQAGKVTLSVYSNSSFTNHVTGSPVVLNYPGSVNGLSHVQHGNIIRGELRRQLTGTLDNLCIDWLGLNLVDSLKLPNDTSLCDGKNLMIDIGMGSDYSYSWNTGINDSIITINQPGTYIATVQKGCASSTDTIVVTQRKSDPIGLPNDTVLCPGEVLSLNIGQGSNASYLWNTGSSDSILTVSQPGIYIANVGNPCSVSDTIQVLYKEPLTPQIQDTSFCLSAIKRISYANMNASFLWNTGETTNSISPIETGWYFVEVTNECETFVDSAYVELIDCPECHVFIPNSFTPGNDGINDFFGPVTNCDQLKYTLKIYNRWGNLVADLNETTGDWDGMYEGKYLQPAVFTYQFEYIIPGMIPIKRDLINGIVTIIR